jgi:hypothetical protein
MWPICGNTERSDAVTKLNGSAPRVSIPKQTLGATMKEEQRSQALVAWRALFNLPDHRVDAEDRYNRLLRSADDMERYGLISSDEWRRLVQQAGTLFASSAECHVVKNRSSLFVGS